MADTMIRFTNNNLGQFLTKEELMNRCPSAFRECPTNPKLSTKYIHANTSTIVNDLEKLGWLPVEAKQCRAQKNSSGIRSFHMIAFQNENVKITKQLPNGEEVIDAYPRIILTNSHDGFNSFKFMVGLYRLVCSNGLVVASDEFVNMSIRHINYDFETLRHIVNQAIEEVPKIVCTMNDMKNTNVSEETKREIAKEVVRIRKNIASNEKFDIDEQTINNILTPNREDDKSNDLWTIYNVCQEKMIRGGFHMLNNKVKMRKQKSISSIKKNMDYNQKLWLTVLKHLSTTKQKSLVNA